jgi:hypothetical protein
MDMKMDKDTQRAWHGWVNFTQAAGVSVIVVAIIVAFVTFLLV